MEKDIGKALGGSEDFSIYKKKDSRPACDMIAHLLRSIYWQPNHIKHLPKTLKKGNLPPPIKQKP